MKSTHDGMSFNRQDAFGVKKVIGVRVSSCQRKYQRKRNGGVAQQVRALPVKAEVASSSLAVTAEIPRSCGEKEIMPDYGSGGGGSNPSGSASGSAKRLSVSSARYSLRDRPGEGR
jgi:hypothetical protein